VVASVLTREGLGMCMEAVNSEALAASMEEDVLVA